MAQIIAPGEVLADEPHAAHPVVPQNRMSRKRWFQEVGWRHIVGVLACVWALFPVSYIVSASLNPLGNVVSTTIIPNSFSLVHFQALFETPSIPFTRWALNSIIVAVVVVFVQLLCSAMAAYAFSRFRFRGRRPGLLSLLLIQMFPQFLAVVAIFIVFTEVNDLYPTFGFDSIWGLLLLYLGGALGVNTYLMKGFLDTVPRE